jgi:hypothetical protein
MIKLASLALFALVCSVPVAQAAPSKAIFKGSYDGIASLETVTGQDLFYSPLRLNISKTGLITGTAFREEVLYKVTGKIGKVTVQYGRSYVGKASGTFSDGTKWTANVNAAKGLTAYNTILGKGTQGAYSGRLSLTKQ